MTPVVKKGRRRRATDRIVDLETHEAAHVSPGALARYYGINVMKIYRDIDKGAIRGVVRIGPGPHAPIRIPTKAARTYGRPVD